MVSILILNTRNYSKICISLQSYSLFEIFDNYIYMKTAKLPKSKGDKIDEPNLGYTKDELGKQVDTLKIHIMEMYYLKWNIDRRMMNQIEMCYMWT